MQQKQISISLHLAASKIQDPGSCILDPGSWMLDPRSWIQELGVHQRQKLDSCRSVFFCFFRNQGSPIGRIRDRSRELLGTFWISNGFWIGSSQGKSDIFCNDIFASESIQDLTSPKMFAWQIIGKNVSPDLAGGGQKCYQYSKQQVLMRCRSLQMLAVSIV